jgi:ABC-type polar amino acid transport system ATPase subunit
VTNSAIADAESGRPKLQLTDIRKNYGPVEAVRGVSLSVSPGQVVAVIGPSGCGKSTLLRCINHLEEPTSGRVRLGDQEIDYGNKTNLPRGRALARFRARFGMVFQQFDLFAHKTVLENVTIGQTVVQKKPREQAERIARDFLHRVGLSGMEHRLPRELSGGQQQRVAMARALALSPEVLLFDEVTSALDPELVGEVLEVVQALAADGATMVVVTHEMAFARDVADKIVFMDRGRMEEEGSPQDVLVSPTNPRLRSFLARFHRDAG